MSTPVALNKTIAEQRRTQRVARVRGGLRDGCEIDLLPHDVDAHFRGADLAPCGQRRPPADDRRAHAACGEQS